MSEEEEMIEELVNLEIRKREIKKKLLERDDDGQQPNFN